MDSLNQGASGLPQVIARWKEKAEAAMDWAQRAFNNRDYREELHLRREANIRREMISEAEAAIRAIPLPSPELLAWVETQILDKEHAVRHAQAPVEYEYYRGWRDAMFNLKNKLKEGPAPPTGAAPPPVEISELHNRWNKLALKEAYESRSPDGDGPG